MSIFASNSTNCETSASPRSHRRASRRVASLGLAIALVFAAPLRAANTEERCGWLENPTPGNWWLRDARGLWIISAQGDPYAEGVEKMPELEPEHLWRPMATTDILAPASAALSTITRSGLLVWMPLGCCLCRFVVPTRPCPRLAARLDLLIGIGKRSRAAVPYPVTSSARRPLSGWPYSPTASTTTG